MSTTAIKNTYELFFTLKPTLGEDELEKNIVQIENSIKNYGGEIIRSDQPMRSRFAHKMKGFRDGYYVSLIFNSNGEVPNLLKRALSISDAVLRHIIVVKKDN